MDIKTSLVLLSRFVNLIDLLLNDGVLPEKAWNIVRNVRNNDYYIKSEICGKLDNPRQFFSIPQIVKNFDSMATLMDQNISYEAQYIPRENIDLAGEMFVFLNSCPSPLVSFYNHIFHERSTTEMLIALNQEKKRALTSKSQEIADILFKKLESNLGFHHNKPSDLLKWKEIVSSDAGKILLI